MMADLVAEAGAELGGILPGPSGPTQAHELRCAANGTAGEVRQGC